MPFDSVLGQEQAKSLLHSALAHGRLGHAYLFAGPDGVGKTLFAQELAQVLLCRSEGERPCNACSDCTMVRHDRHPDLFLVQAAEEKRFITIEQARDMGHTLTLKPVQSERRVAIVREAERLREEAANSILKTLEEPAPFGMLILTTARPRALLATIRSRCQEVRFVPLAPEHVLDILRRRDEWADDDIQAAARFAQGSASRAIQLLENNCLEMCNELLPAILALPNADVFALSDDLLGWARTFSKKLEPQRERVREVLGMLAAVYRDALALRANAPSEMCPDEKHGKTLADLAGRLSDRRILSILDTIWDARRQTDANAAMGLILDSLFTRLGELQAA